MANSFFNFKKFSVHQDLCAMKVTTDGCLFGAFISREINSLKSKFIQSLDIGTGTGLLTLMLAQNNPTLKIDAIEIDKNAALQAFENIKASPFSENIKVIQADVKDYQFKEKYDIIICNPPFYENELKGNDMQKNLAHHNDGLLLLDVISIIKNNLSKDGVFFILLPIKRADEIRNLIIENYLSVQKITFVRQTTQHDYFRIIISGNNKSITPIEAAFDEISIKNKTGNYTPEFISLLKDYYINL